MKTLKYFSLLLLLLKTSTILSQPNHYSRIQVVAVPDSIIKWNKAGVLPAHFSYNNDILEMELSTFEMEEFRKRNILFTDISQRFYQQLPSPANTQTQRLMGSQTAPVNYSHGSMGGYHTYSEAMNVLDEMRIKFPSLVSEKDTIGWTYEGRPIVAVRISDNAAVNESNEDEWLMTALHHANEVMGEEIVFYFTWFLLENYETDKEIRTLLNNSALYIIPVINPDGLAFNESTNPSGGGGWRKNRKPRVISSTTHYGIDLNRNYGFNRAYTHTGQLGQAGSSFAGNDYYRGTAAWSEAETSALREFCKEHNFTSAFNYHAWDDSFNYPWNFDRDSLTADSLKYKTIAAYCTEDNQFEKGTFNRTLGYTANGTSDDWLYGEQTEKNKIFAFTIEVGKSFWPAPALIDKYCDSLLQANMKMMRMAAKYAPLQETSADTISSLSNYISYNIKRYSITDTGFVFTVSITPLDPVVSSIEPPIVYSDLSLLESRPDTLAYLLSPSITDGTSFRFLLKVDNGKWSITDTITKVFKSSGTLALGCTETVRHNNPATAIRLSENQPTYGTIQEKHAEEWYYFENTVARKNISVILSNLPSDYDIALFNDRGQQINISERPYKLNDSIVFNATMQGLFKVRVYGYKKNYDPFNCYSLQLALSDKPFAQTSYFSPKEKEARQLIISVYPQPTASSVSVAIKSSGPQPISWSIVDNTGKKLKAGNRNLPRGLSVFIIDMDKMPPAIYRLCVFNEVNGELQTAAIVKL